MVSVIICKFEMNKSFASAVVEKHISSGGMLKKLDLLMNERRDATSVRKIIEVAYN